MSKTWKIGIVCDTAKPGKGDHGTHLSFTGLPGVEQVLADPNAENLGPRLKAIGAARHYMDYRAMLDAEAPDIVTVCSRLPDDHFPVIKAAAERGCHILCEKPLTASLKEADAIVALAEAKGIKVAVAHLARHALVFRTVKTMIERGEIGQPLTFYGRGKEDERGGGEDLMVLGTHILDLALFLFGKAEYVFADVRQNGIPITADDRLVTSEPVGLCAGDNVWAGMKFAGDVTGFFESRKNLCRGPVRMGITVAGSDGTISVRYDQERALRLSRSPLPPEDEAAYETVELHDDRTLPENAQPFDYERYGPQPGCYFADNNRFVALDLLRAIEEDRQPVSNMYNAREVLEMIYGIYAASLERNAVTLPLADRNHPLGE